MNYKTKVIDFFKRFSPVAQKDGVLSQYQKMMLDNTPEPDYTIESRSEFVSDVTSKYIGKITMEEVKKPAITVETIVNAVENKYPKAVVELAKILQDMKVQYSLHASAFSSKLFEAQDSLGLTSNEVSKIMEEIISQKDVIIDTTQASINIINKPKVI